jgi:hypothetical protein
VRKLPFVSASLIVVGMTSAALVSNANADSSSSSSSNSGSDTAGNTLLSVAKPSGQLLSPASRPHPSATATATATAATQARTTSDSAQLPAAASVKAGGSQNGKSKQSDNGQGSTAAASQPGGAAKSETSAETDAGAVALPPPDTVQLLTTIFSEYRNNPNPAAQGELIRLVKQLLMQAGTKTPAAAIIKSAPVLSDMGWRAIDAGGGRIWSTTRLPDVHELLVQWADSKPIVEYVGRRHRIRKVTYAVTWHLGSLPLPPGISLQDAHLVNGAENSHVLMLVGSENGTLWLHTFQRTADDWKETASRLDSIPDFLTNNVSGKVSFRGPDLIFTVGRVLPGKVENSTSKLPAAESSTYKFWVHLTDQGYVLLPQLVDEAQFSTVKMFMDAIGSSKTDIAKSLLLDGRLMSIPKYVGLHGASPSFRVVQMSSPPSGAPRYRLVTGDKDDLIFDVIRVKDKSMIRAIFIAPADQFLQAVADHLPTYDKVAPPPAAAEHEQVSVDKH